MLSGSYTAAGTKAWRVKEWKVRYFLAGFSSNNFWDPIGIIKFFFFLIFFLKILYSWMTFFFYHWWLHLHRSLMVCMAGGYSKIGLSQSTYFCMQFTHAAVSFCWHVVHVWKGVYSNDLTMLQRRTTASQVEDLSCKSHNLPRLRSATHQKNREKTAKVNMRIDLDPTVPCSLQLLSLFYLSLLFQNCYPRTPGNTCVRLPLSLSL